MANLDQLRQELEAASGDITTEAGIAAYEAAHEAYYYALADALGFQKNEYGGIIDNEGRAVNIAIMEALLGR